MKLAVSAMALFALFTAALADDAELLEFRATGNIGLGEQDMIMFELGYGDYDGPALGWARADRWVVTGVFQKNFDKNFEGFRRPGVVSGANDWNLSSALHTTSDLKSF